MPDKSEPLFLGVDLGGTKILTAVVDSQGNMLARDHSVTPAAKGPEAVIPAMLDSVASALNQAGKSIPEISAIGVGAAGLSNPETGVLFTSPNLPGWRDVPLKGIIEEKLGIKTFLINDANAAALGELCFGAARNVLNFIYLGLGTGIGAGIVADGKICAGAAGTAGEVGHMVIHDDGPLCNCGNRGCWEILASGAALARDARLRIKEGARTSILDYAAGDMERINAEIIQKAAQDGDRLAGELISRIAYYLGVGLANLINIFNPEMIVIGGGLSNMGDMLLGPACEEAGRRAFKQAYRVVRFACAELGRNSGVLGAAALARDSLKRTQG